MAKKIDLDRLSSAPVSGGRREEATRTTTTKRTETRHGNVIRRRRKPASSGKPSLSSLPKATRPAPEPSALKAPEVQPEVELAPVEPQAAPVEQEAAPAAPVAEEAPVAEHAPVEQEAAPAAPAAEEAPAAAAPAVEEAPAAEHAPVEQEAAPAAPVVEEAPAADSSSDETAAAADAGARSPARAEADKRRAAKATPDKPRLPRVPGLGKAVVRPPPGWDPANPKNFQPEPPPANDAWRGRPAGERPRPGAAAPAADPAGRGAPSSEGADPGRGRRSTRGRRGRVEATTRVDARNPRRPRKHKKSGPKMESTRPKAQKRKIQVDHTISVRQFAMDLGVKAKEILKALLNLGTMATINDQLDFETAQLVAAEFEYEVVNVGFQEESHLIQVEEEDISENAIERPPVVTIMGHVDHGKTTLLDTIRRSNVAEKEAGGITQHISAYQVKRGDQAVTFIDTPGHQAFTEMRARGANATDIVILVVAADDGIMPQTVESINHAKAAGVPIVVAINKCDKPGVQPDTIRQKLMEHELVPEEYGGDTLMINVSALAGTGIDELLDAVLLVSELAEFKADPERHAEGVVLEAQLETGRGPVATVLVQKGTLQQGDSVVLGSIAGRVRAMTDHRGKRIKKALPSTPVEIIGLSGVPAAGDNFVVVGSDKDAKALAEHRAEAARKASMQTKKQTTLQDLFNKLKEGETARLNLVVKGDVQGSVEALKASLNDIVVEGAEVQVLHSAVGAISESDVTMATAYDAIVLGFNVRPDAKARRAAESNGVEVRTYRVIYELLDDVRKALVGLLEPTFEERHQGTAEVREVFHIPKVGSVAGCFITDGMVARNHQARLVRDGVIVWEGRLASLRRFKNDVREVKNGFECGMGLDGFQDIKQGDEIETYIVETVAATG